MTTRPSSRTPFDARTSSELVEPTSGLTYRTSSEATLPTRVVHADWGSNPGKRWMARGFCGRMESLAGSVSKAQTTASATNERSASLRAEVIVHELVPSKCPVPCRRKAFRPLVKPHLARHDLAD